MAAGTATAGGDPSRHAIFDALRHDRDRTGPVAVRLLQLAEAGDPFVRGEVMGLLSSLTWCQPAWPAAAEVALARLTDPDERVRRRAARLVVDAGRPDLALTVLGELTDPVVRTVLAHALGAAVAHLRADPQASVRFLAHLETLRTAPSRRWPALDAALLADAGEAAGHLDDLGQRWEGVLRRREREHHAYAVAAQLLAHPGTRDVGADLARHACHDWRAAAVELLPLLVHHGGPEPSPAVARALTTASISEAARRVHGALVAGAPFTPYRGVRRPRCGAPQPPYDHTSAAALLAGRPVGIARLRDATEVFGALLDAGPLTFRQAAQLYNLTFLRPGRMRGECAPLWLRHAGPTAVPRLLAGMTPDLGHYGIGEYHLRGLAGMGRHALPALPAVTALIERRTRVPVNDSTRDAEMITDERLLAAALDTRRAILADPAP